MADDTKTLKMWKEAVSATKDCLPLEVLERMVESSATDPKAAAHLAECPHCQTELAMLKSFEASVPSADEGAAVAWIAAQLERKQNAPAAQQAVTRVPFWRAIFRVPYLAGAAALAVMLALGVSLYKAGDSDGRSTISNNVGTGSVRSGSVRLVSPVGDLQQAPVEFRWEAVSGASSYSIELKDVAGVVLASAKSTRNILAVTPEMKANISSGKPLKWKVTALDASGREVASSAAENFKVK
jgi:hypothetical protein